MTTSAQSWESQGCEACRLAWSCGAGSSLRLLGVNYAKHARVHQCQVCRAFWDEGERAASEISEQEARVLLEGAEVA